MLLFRTTILVLLFCPNLFSQTVGTIYNSAPSLNGFTLLAPNSSHNTWLIDNCGEIVNTWTSSYRPGLATYFLEDGSLMRTCNVQNTNFTAGGKGGKVEKYNWDGTLEWGYYYSSDQYCQHHDIAPMPNGNVLILAWEAHTVPEAVAMGRDPNTFSFELWTEHIIEVQPVGIDSGIIVWEWHISDHLIQEFDNSKNNYGVVADFPELIDINFPTNNGSDWMHANSIDYNSQLDQIVIGSKNLHEFYIIDHSTTTAEAASHSGGNSGKGGDFLYRWGNPIVYQHGSSNDKVLFGQHNVQWIQEGLPNEGKILIFNNGEGRSYSSVDIIDPTILLDGSYDTLPNGAYAPESLFWTYVDPAVPSNFYAGKISGAQQLSNGNVLICEGPFGNLFEVTEQGDMVWNYINPVSSTGVFAQGQTGIVNNGVFRALRFTEDYPGLQGKNLIPLGYVEIDPIASYCSIYEDVISISDDPKGNFLLYPNPGNGKLTVKTPNTSTNSISVYNMQGILVYNNKTKNSLINKIDISENPPGIYLVKINHPTNSLTKKLIIE